MRRGTTVVRHVHVCSLSTVCQPFAGGVLSVYYKLAHFYFLKRMIDPPFLMVDVADSSPSGCSRGQAAESNGWLADFVDMPASPFALFNVSSADLGEPPCSFQGQPYPPMSLQSEIAAAPLPAYREGLEIDG